MPEISRFYGIRIFMFFREHNPPHFHAKYQGYEAIFEIKDGTVSGKFPRRALKLVFEWLDMHKDELLDNWKCIENRKNLNNIDPLK